MLSLTADAVLEPQETVGSIPGLGRSPWRRKWQPTPLFLAEESPWAEEPGGIQYKPPYKLTSDAHRKDRGQRGKGTKEMMVWEQVFEWVGGLSLDGGC